MDSALQSAIAEKAKIEGEISALRARLRDIELFISMYSEFSAKSPGKDSEEPPLIAHARRASIPDYVEVLLTGGRQMTTSQLLVELDQLGVKVGGEDQHKRIVNLSSSLSRAKDRFDSDRIRGWSLKPRPSVEAPEAGETAPGINDLV